MNLGPLEKLRLSFLPPVAFLVSVVIAAMVGLYFLARSRGWLVLLLAVGLTSCTASQAFIVTGESITATGRQYVATETAMRKGVDEGKVTTAQFRVWGAFSDKFELGWDSAAAAWLRARATKQQVERGRIEAAIAGIVAELTGFYVRAREANLLPAGAP